MRKAKYLHLLKDPDIRRWLNEVQPITARVYLQRIGYLKEAYGIDAKELLGEESTTYILNGYRMHCDMVRPHASLGDRTSAETAGYRFKSPNRVLELIALSGPHSSKRSRAGEDEWNRSLSAARIVVVV